eukprot:5175336-Pyramimonas_sp.AAC.1
MPRGARLEARHVPCSKRPRQCVACWLSMLVTFWRTHRVRPTLSVFVLSSVSIRCVLCVAYRGS